MAADKGHVSLHVDCETKQKVDGKCSHGTLGRQIPGELPKPKVKIQKVHFLLRDKQHIKDYLEPQALTFGPIHHGKKPQYAKGEACKKTWTNVFLKRTGQSEQVLLKKIEEDIEQRQLRRYFDDEVLNDYTDDQELVKMLLLDGCALLLYMSSIAGEVEIPELNTDMYTYDCVYYDIFTLENQLPFRVLDLLISHEKEKWHKIIRKFISLSTPLELPEDRKLSLDADDEEQRPSHLLELLRESVLVPPQNVEKIKDMSSLNRYPGGFFRSVMELKKSGIHFKPKESRYFNNISFKKHWITATLEIPNIDLGGLTVHTSMNLIAYELSPDYNSDMEVISYYWLLNKLIDHPEDVKQLRKAKILRNFLASDEEVSQTFNSLALDLILTNPLQHYGVIKDIQDHYSNRWKTKWAEFYSTYFSKPWSLVGLIGGLILFAFTAAQTYCAIRSLQQGK